MIGLRFAAACAASACTLAASAAVADIHWVVNGVFDDGTTLSGYFNVNTYGYLGSYKFTTQAGPSLAAGVYETGDFASASASTINLQLTYQEDLHLDFANPYGVSGPIDPLLVTSYECVGSYGCAGPSGGDRRYLVSGGASAPEPAAWTLMLMGVAGLGVSLRRRRAPLTA